MLYRFIHSHFQCCSLKWCESWWKIWKNIFNLFVRISQSNSSGPVECVCHETMCKTYFDPFQCAKPPKLASQIGKRYWFSKAIKLWQPIRYTHIRYPCKSMATRENILSIAQWEKWNFYYILGFRSYVTFLVTRVRSCWQINSVSVASSHFSSSLRISALRLLNVHYIII